MKVLSPAFIGNIFEIKKISRGNLTIRRFFWVLLWIWPTIQPFTSRHMDHNISTFFFLSPIKLHQRRFSLKYTVMIIFRMINAPALCKPRVLVLRPNILVSMFVSSLATQNLARIKFQWTTNDRDKNHHVASESYSYTLPLISLIDFFQTVSP